MIKTLLLFTFLLFSTLISNQDKDGKKLLEVYLENRDQILKNNKPEIDYKWDISQSEDYVLIAINGQIQYGAELKFIIHKRDCYSVYETFEFYTIANHENIKNIENYILPVDWNEINIQTKVLAVKKFGLGHLVLFTMGLYAIEDHIDFLEKYNSYNPKIINNESFIASDYFDILNNKWSLKGIRDALNNAQELCFKMK